MEPDRSETSATLTSETAARCLQEETLLAFTAILASSGTCHRKLALCLAAGQAGCAAALAVCALGGASLVLDSAGSLQAAGRLGATDFTVNDLTEAVRILKNELRKGDPVSVGLVGDARALVAEMVRRGVQPDVVCGTGVDHAMYQPLLDLGAGSLAVPAAQSYKWPGVGLCWDRAGSAAERRKNDKMLSDRMPADNLYEPEVLRTVQSRWLRAAPRMFPRDYDRIYWGVEKER